MIETETVESVVGTLLKGVPTGVVVLAVLLALLIRFRTNSGHSVSRWLWHLASGKAKSDDSVFNEFMDAQDNLNQFRFISGKARTTAQMHSLIKWCDLHNEDIHDIKACGPYFNREQPGLKAANHRPTRANLSRIKLALIGCVLLLGVSTVIATANRALITVKETNTWLLIEMHLTISVLGPNQARLSREQCQQPLINNVASSGFRERDITVICEFYADPEFSKFIDKTIREQRWVFGLVAAMLLSSFWFMNMRLLQGSAALTMASRLNQARPHQ